jgi:hypothetical protein
VGEPRPFRVMLGFDSGSMTPSGTQFVRRLSEMADAYQDQATVSAILADGDDPVIYTRVRRERSARARPPAGQDHDHQRGDGGVGVLHDQGQSSCS